MLTCLRVRNFAIIDELEVELGPGLNVVTGETGAGKSILIDALGLVLGDKAKSEIVRTGAPQAEVEALFELGSPAQLRHRLEAAEIEVDEGDGDTHELVIRRVVTAQGRSRAYVNGRLATQAQLVALAAGLADISSQHEHQTLVDPGTHLDYLDAYGGLDGDAAAMRDAHRALASCATALDEARAQLTGRSERADFLAFQIKEIDDAAPQSGEIAALQIERERLRHGEKLLRAAGQSEEALYARDGSITEELGRLVAILRDAAELDPRLEGAAAALETAEAQLTEAARDLGHYARSVTMDPERLAEVDERLHRLQRLAKKYAPLSPDPEQAMVAHRDAAKAELAALQHTEDRIAELEQKRARALAIAGEKARALSKRRHEVAAELSSAITREIRSLGMSSASIQVAVRSLEARGELVVDGARITPSGMDHVEMLIAPNAGEDAKPLRRIASGGELSRALLAIKRVLASARRRGDAPEGRSLYVFDEVDTGVGGAVAETIGLKLRDVAQHDQVLCITHLAPIAVYASTHFVVKKEVVDGRTRSDIVPLDERERVDEVARMLGGIQVTKKTRDVAAEMLRAAHPS